MYLYYYQAEELLKIIDGNQLVIIEAGTMITNAEIEILLRHGVNYKKLLQKKAKSIFNEFNFSMLAESLKFSEENNYNYDQLCQFVKHGKYIPLSKRQIFINKRIMQLNLQDFIGFKNEIIEDVIINGIINKKTTAQIISDAGHKSGNWFLGETVLYIENILTAEANVYEIKENSHSIDPLVYKRVFNGNCAKYCTNLYLTDGQNSKPKIFSLSELEDNGFNNGTNPLLWKPTIRPTFRNCSCSLHEKLEGFIWNTETQSFSTPDPDWKPNFKKRKPILIRIGDKEFYA